MTSHASCRCALTRLRVRIETCLVPNRANREQADEAERRHGADVSSCAVMKLLSCVRSGCRLQRVPHLDALHLRFSSSFFTEQHEELRRSVRKIVEKDINPYVEQWEESGQFDGRTLFKKMGDAGLLGITRPVELFNGLGVMQGDYDIKLKADASPVSVNTSCILVARSLFSPPVFFLGSHFLAQTELRQRLEAEKLECSIMILDCGAILELHIKTTAERRGDDLVINGGKMWITNGCQADWMCLLANTRRDGPRHRTKSLICLPLKTPGVTVARSIKKMGHHSSDTAQLFFEDVRVPAKNIIGEEGMGFIYQMLQFQEERLAAAISSAPVMDRIIRETRDYCRQRKVFGAPLIQNQVIQFRLAELQTEVEAFRALCYRAAGQLMEGENVTLLASMAKLKCGRLLREVADSCLQYWGGMGYSDEVLISRSFRDARLFSIGAGADEVMLAIIAKMTGSADK
ncbi:unnamed protein product [Ixodes pacificus]